MKKDDIRLKNLDKNKFKSGTKAREAGRKGGIKSGIAKREKRTMRQIIADMLNGKVPEYMQGRVAAHFAPYGTPERKLKDEGLKILKTMTAGEAALARQLEKAIRGGDTRALESLMHMKEGKPDQTHKVTDPDGEPLKAPVVNVYGVAPPAQSQPTDGKTSTRTK